MDIPKIEVMVRDRKDTDWMRSFAYNHTNANPGTVVVQIAVTPKYAELWIDLSNNFRFTGDGKPLFQEFVPYMTWDRKGEMNFRGSIILCFNMIRDNLDAVIEYLRQNLPTHLEDLN